MKPAEPEVMKIAKIGGETFVDVGANVGEYSRRLWMHYDRIVSLEPLYPAFEKLRHSFRWRSLFTHYIPVECAASNMDGTTWLFLDREGKRCSGSGDTIEPVFNYRPQSIPTMEFITHHSPKDGGPKVLVECRRLDTLLPTLRVQSVDFLKIDVEGAEFRVLEGARNTLKQTRRVIVELHDREKRKELETYVGNTGFSTTWVDDDHIYGKKS